MAENGRWKAPAPDDTDADCQAVSLDDRHRDELHASGLTCETIARSGIYSTENAAIREILGWQPKVCDWGRGMVIPFLQGNGQAPFARVKLDFPRSDKNGKPIKYESPRKRGNRAYLPPGFDGSLPGATTMVVTEGEKKSLSVQQRGIPCVGLVGVWGWQEKRRRSDTGRSYGPRRLIPDLDEIDWKGREAVLIFDSDLVSNSSVALAESRLSEELARHGAVVKVARIPAGGDEKIGIDDYLVAAGDDADKVLADLIASAVVPEVPGKPSAVDWARMFVDEHFRIPEGHTLQWWRDEFYRWTGFHYVKVPRSELEVIILGWLDDRCEKASPALARDVVQGIAAICRITYDLDQPCFVGEASDVDPRDVIAVQNGILRIPADPSEGEVHLRDHTPAWFSPSCLPYRFNPEATCEKWKAFLREVLEDRDCIGLLQQWFGYALTADTSLQKMLLLVGARRSGKGTILRVMQHAVGTDSCVSPTLSSLSTEFGLWPLVDKRLCLFPDAHLGYRSDSARALEVLKSVTGEDRVSINRKKLPYLPNVRLAVRFVLTCNELPRFADASDALGSRLLILPFRRSFDGREDYRLEGKLMREAPGILNWAIGGLFRLRKAGRFIEPERSREVRAEYRRMTSPVASFVEDRCRVGLDYKVKCDTLFGEWKLWCDMTGHKIGATSTFGSHLQASVPGINRTRLRDGGVRCYFYEGVEIGCEPDEDRPPEVGTKSLNEGGHLCEGEVQL